jgi:4'-phosphopantetheinyl transferase EntD
MKTNERETTPREKEACEEPPELEARIDKSRRVAVAGRLIPHQTLVALGGELEPARRARGRESTDRMRW